MIIQLKILNTDIISSADTTDTTESAGSVNAPEKTADSSYDDTAALGQNINDTADEAVKKSVEWYKHFYSQDIDMYDFTMSQIEDYEDSIKWVN